MNLSNSARLSSIEHSCNRQAWWERTITFQANPTYDDIMGFICRDLVNGNVAAEDGDKTLLLPQWGNCSAPQQQVDGKNDH